MLGMPTTTTSAAANDLLIGLGGPHPMPTRRTRPRHPDPAVGPAANHSHRDHSRTGPLYNDFDINFVISLTHHSSLASTSAITAVPWHVIYSVHPAARYFVVTGGDCDCAVTAL